MVTGRVVTVDGAEIAFDQDGVGRDVVWVHGICEHRESWTPITSQLLREFRCTRLDLRGHGESSRLERYDPGGFITDLTSIIEATCTMPPVVIGHSLGGVIATVAAALGITGPVLCVDQGLKTDSFADFVHELAPRLRDPAQYPDAILDEKRALGMDLVPEPMLGALSRLARASDQRVVLDTWQAMLDGDHMALQATDAALEGLLPDVNEPYLALHGSAVSQEYTNWFRATIPNGTVEVWDGYGHWPHLVNPQRFADRVHSFLA